MRGELKEGECSASTIRNGCKIALKKQEEVEQEKLM